MSHTKRNLLPHEWAELHANEHHRLRISVNGSIAPGSYSFMPQAEYVAKLHSLDTGLIEIIEGACTFSECEHCKRA